MHAWYIVKKEARKQYIYQRNHLSMAMTVCVAASKKSISALPFSFNDDATIPINVLANIRPRKWRQTFKMVLHLLFDSYIIV